MSIKIETVADIDTNNYRASQSKQPQSAVGSIMERTQMSSNINSVIGLVDKHSMVESSPISVVEDSPAPLREQEASPVQYLQKKRVNGYQSANVIDEVHESFHEDELIQREAISLGESMTPDSRFEEEKDVQANKDNMQPTAEDILKEILEEDGRNKVAGDYETFPESVVQQTQFEKADDDYNLFKTAASKHEPDPQAGIKIETASNATRKKLMRTQTDSKNVFVNRARDIISKASQEDILSQMTDDRFHEDSRPATANSVGTEARNNKAGIAGGLLATQRT